MKQFALFLLSVVSMACDVKEADLRGKGPTHLAEITRQPWAAKWQGAKLEKVRLVTQKADLAQPTGLPPAWHAEVRTPEGASGYLLWDAAGKGGLIEFALDAKLSIDSADAKVLENVPFLQQFPIAGADGKPTASGCVPTAGAGLVKFWIARGYPAWGNQGKDTLETLTKRLRSRLKVEHFPDTDGFTENAMPLTGAMPEDLAKAIQEDAQQHQVPMSVGIYHFSFPLLIEEINADRPVLLSCVVRVPHKPHLSWGHEVIGSGWARLAGAEFVGILDNFYPTQEAQAVRWIRADAFLSITTVKPADEIHPR